MKYKKPVCECGVELEYICNVGYHRKFEINKNGSVKAKHYDEDPIGFEDAFEKLWCPMCDRLYEFKFLDGRIYRGDRHESS